MATIAWVKGQALTLPLTDEDRVWAGRMLLGEEGARASMAAYVAVLSTMIRRWMQVQERNGQTFWPSFTRLLIGTPEGAKGYSQPIAHQWRYEGSPEQIERRRRVRDATWEDLPLNIRLAVDHVFLGNPLQPESSGAIHFADGPTSAKFLEANPGSKVVKSPAANVLVRMAWIDPDPIVQPVAWWERSL